MTICINVSSSEIVSKNVRRFRLTQNYFQPATLRQCSSNGSSPTATLHNIRLQQQQQQQQSFN